jgi:6-pyruvoyltetrahydropterin/6-carboxytetrahydropterin synthase
MFHLKRKIEIDMGHRVPFHESKCKHLHGHRYTIQVHFKAESTIPVEEGRSDSQMLIDFGVAKQLLMEVIHDVYDHRLVLWHKDPILEGLRKAHPAVANSIVTVPCIPTAEGLAQFWFEQMAIEFSHQRNQPENEGWNRIGLRMAELIVWETPNGVASYVP